MSVNDQAVGLGDNRDAEAEFADGADHAVDLIVILARVARVFDQPVDRPSFDLQSTAHGEPFMSIFNDIWF